MILEIATPKQSDELLHFYNNFRLGGWAETRLQRHQNFFSMYALQSEQYRTYVLRDSESKEIAGLASFVARDTFLQGRPVRVALATDLRVSSSRQAIMEWTKHFLPVLDQVKKEMAVEHVFSAINTAEASALNTFVRPRNMRRPIPRYYLYRKFNLVTLHGQFPWAPKPLSSLRIREASESMWPALSEYAARRSSYRPFTSVHDSASLKQKMSRFPGLRLSDFLIAMNSDEQVVGCLCSWSPRQVQDWIPLSYSLQAHNFRQFLKFGRMFGWTRNLTKPLDSTGIEAPLNFRFLSQIHADNEDIFESLLYTAFEKAERNQFLVYAHVDQDYRLAPPESWISAVQPYALYAVLPPQEAVPHFLQPSEALNPEIEASFVV